MPFVKFYENFMIINDWVKFYAILWFYAEYIITVLLYAFFTP